MLIDDVTIDVKAGNGGDGTVAFNRNKMELGPVGGAGGNGGSVWCVGSADIGALALWRNSKSAHAKDGDEGGVQYRDGTDGADLEFPVPVGTVIHRLDNGAQEEMVSVGQRILLAKGGHGGHGNYHFRSSTDTSPRRFQHGTAGERRDVRLELKLIADVGLIGLPNAGKSTLLNECTRARQKIGDYPFTTLEPALGMYYGLVLADIPGLIEGAASGRGLGTKFLRHVERTRTLLHLVAATSDDPVADWKVVRGELAAHNPALLSKEEVVLLTKTDAVGDDRLQRISEAFATAGVPVVPVSVHDPAAMERVHELLRKLRDLKLAG